MTPATFLSHDSIACTMTFAVGPTIYEYTVPPGDHIRKALVINKASPMQALNYVKKVATETRKVDRA